MSALTTQELSDLWDAMSPTQQGAVTRAIAAAHNQGRDQGLREAAERARGDGIPGISADDDEIVADWLDAAAIEQLRGK